MREVDDLMPSLMHDVLQIGPVIVFEVVEPVEETKWIYCKLQNAY